MTQLLFPMGIRATVTIGNLCQNASGQRDVSTTYGYDNVLQFSLSIIIKSTLLSKTVYDDITNGLTFPLASVEMNLALVGRRWHAKQFN